MKDCRRFTHMRNGIISWLIICEPKPVCLNGSEIVGKYFIHIPVTLSYYTESLWQSERAHNPPILAYILFSPSFFNSTYLYLALIFSFAACHLYFDHKLLIVKSVDLRERLTNRMSRSSKSKSAADRQSEMYITQFRNVTGASPADAKSFIGKYKRLDVAIDSYYNDPNQFKSEPSKKTGADRVARLGKLFDKYKDPDGDEITIDGTLRLCEDLAVNPEDVVLLAIAYELKSPSMGLWTRKGWVDGWLSLGQDTIDGMKSTLSQLSPKLASDPRYFQQVYSYTFDFARTEGQRSIGLDFAQGYWSLLIPYGLSGGALSHIAPDEDGDDAMDSDEQGWKPEYTEWWFDFLREKECKGVSKDTWTMFLEFVRAIDSKFERYDETAAWPSLIDDFVAWAREKLATKV
ncbi:hypothetical protein M0805_007553 [Coniferiporia weirii]|nr:hypothetical protein M0805_007553 [Coniferiporia weirii]